jgi:A/G-specific adenine glycosylase
MTAPIDGFDRRTLARFRRGLRRWYRQHARPLPWRETSDPYRIWISEIMLQQTTVVAVVPYFERFLKKFPTLAALAAAPESAVLRMWEGLGYYSRARNIHKAARQIAGERGGVFPDDVAELTSLPGIGRYTAGAIASFAFDRRAPIVEANTLRLYCRLLGYRGDPRSAAGQKLLWDFAGTLVPEIGAGEFNQALMELGATVCTPESPDCPHCPVRNCCAAAAAGAQTAIPVMAPRRAPTRVTEIAIAIERAGKYLVLKRPPGQRWAGLWDFVRFPCDEPQKPTRGALERALRDRTGLRAAVGQVLAEIRHTVTRFRITLCCHGAEWVSGEIDGEKYESRWVTARQLTRLPMPVTGRQISRLLQAGAKNRLSGRHTAHLP